ncbi:MAG: hypothetical protein GTO18_16990 [Anaerolineales bacterium]|nr:hypothetical protein [Anaerolineales bacterium]
MRRSYMLIILLTLLLLIMSFGPASAAPGSEVRIEVTNEQLIPPTSGPFIASGPAVDAGIICGSGNTNDVFIKESGNPDKPLRRLVAYKQFTCGDGSGEFILKMNMKFDRQTGLPSGNWRVVDGYGEYEDLRGSGKFEGFPLGEGLLEIINGKVRDR